MTAKYLLPCQCGLEVPVGAAQAGAEVSCSCGRTLPVPTLLELKRLQPAPQTSPTVAKRPWTPLQGGMFSGGIVVVVIAVGLAVYFAYVRTKLKTERPPDPDSSLFVADTVGRNVDELWDIWTDLSDLDKYPLRWRAPRYVLHRQADAKLRTYILIALAAAAGGVALSVLGILWKPPAKRRRPKPKGGAGRSSRER